jgi:hypothetical protein
MNMEDAKHPVPLVTVYHQLHPVPSSSWYTFLQAMFGWRYLVWSFLFFTPCLCLWVWVDPLCYGENVTNSHDFILLATWVLMHSWMSSAGMWCIKCLFASLGNSSSYSMGWGQGCRFSAKFTGWVQLQQKPHKTTNSYPHKVGNVNCINFNTNKEVGCGGHGRAIWLQGCP